jgi:hypothetical protein
MRQNFSQITKEEYAKKKLTGGGTPLGADGDPVAFETRTPRDDICWL